MQRRFSREKPCTRCSPHSRRAPYKGELGVGIQQQMSSLKEIIKHTKELYALFAVDYLGHQVQVWRLSEAVCAYAKTHSYTQRQASCLNHVVRCSHWITMTKTAPRQIHSVSIRMSYIIVLVFPFYGVACHSQHSQLAYTYLRCATPHIYLGVLYVDLWSEKQTGDLHPRQCLSGASILDSEYCAATDASWSWPSYKCPYAFSDLLQLMEFRRAWRWQRAETCAARCPSSHDPVCVHVVVPVVKSLTLNTDSSDTFGSIVQFIEWHYSIYGLSLNMIGYELAPMGGFQSLVDVLLCSCVLMDGWGSQQGRPRWRQAMVRDGAGARSRRVLVSNTHLSVLPPVASGTED